MLGTLQAGEISWFDWRGGSNRGSSPGGDPALKWSAEEGLAWKLELPGKGCSTPVVVPERILITAPLGGQDAVLAVDPSGRYLWKTPIGEQRPGRHRNGSGANPSPVTDGAGVYAYFKSGALAALEMDGGLRWKTNLQERFGRDSLYWDIGTSPVLCGGLVIVAVLQDEEGYLAAFESGTGRLVWKVDRTYPSPTENDHSYATPQVFRHRGKLALLVWGADRLTAHSPKDGSLLWTCAGFNPTRRANWVAVASPVIAGDVAVVPYGRGARLAGVRLGGSGDVTVTNHLWEHEDLGAFVPTPSVSDGRVYVLRDRGEVIALDPETGRVFWQGAFPRHRGSYYASPLVTHSRIYAAREDGAVLVAGLGADFPLLAQNDMGERLIASPVPLGDRLLIRGERHLFCVAEP